MWYRYKSKSLHLDSQKNAIKGGKKKEIENKFVFERDMRLEVVGAKKLKKACNQKQALFLDQKLPIEKHRLYEVGFGKINIQ